MTESDIVRLIDHLKHCDGRQRNIEVNTFDNAIEAIEQLRKERDEARKQICESHSRNGHQAYQHAIECNWDCYKEQPRCKSDPNIISLDELARCTRNQTP